VPIFGLLFAHVQMFQSRLPYWQHPLVLNLVDRSKQPRLPIQPLPDLSPLDSSNIQLDQLERHPEIINALSTNNLQAFINTPRQETWILTYLTPFPPRHRNQHRLRKPFHADLPQHINHLRRRVMRVHDNMQQNVRSLGRHPLPRARHDLIDQVIKRLRFQLRHITFPSPLEIRPLLFQLRQWRNSPLAELIPGNLPPQIPLHDRIFISQ